MKVFFHQVCKSNKQINENGKQGCVPSAGDKGTWNAGEINTNKQTNNEEKPTENDTNYSISN